MHGFDVKTIRNVELRRKTFKTTQNYESHHITMNCIDLMSKTSNQRKTTKVILFRWISIDLTSKRSKNAKLQKQSNIDEFASIWRENDQKCWVTSQNIQNNEKLQKKSNYNELHRFDVKTITTTQNYESDQIIMHCINLTSKRSKMLRYVAKLQMWSYYDEFASIWCQNYQKCWVTSQDIQNNANLQNGSNYNELQRFDVKTINKRKTTKAIK